MSKLSICIISPGFDGGGSEDIAIKSANYYFEKNYDVIFLSFKKNGRLKKRLISNIPILFVKMNNILSLSFSKKLKKYKFNHAISFIRHANIATFLARKIGTLKADILHLIEVNTFEGQDKLNFLQRVLQNFLLKISYRNSEDIIAVSTLVKNEIKKKFKVSKNLRVIGNPCIDLKDLNKVKKKKKNTKYTKFVAAGRLHEQKDFIILLRAFQNLKQTEKKNLDTLTIYGSGPEHHNIKKFIKIHNLKRFVFLKNFTDKLDEKLTYFDAFILSSKYEGFGNVIVKALNASLPVIARAKTGGPNDLINSKNGILFKDQKQLTRILKNFDCHRFKNFKYKNFVKKYTDDKICMKYLKTNDK